MEIMSSWICTAWFCCKLGIKETQGLILRAQIWLMHEQVDRSISRMKACVKKKTNWTWAFLSIKQPHFLPLVFSLFWRENFLVGLRRKYLNSIIYFLSPDPTKHTQKSFPSHFLFKVFHLSYFTSKQTHSKCLVGGVEKWKDRKDFNFPPLCLVRSEKVDG